VISFSFLFGLSSQTINFLNSFDEISKMLVNSGYATIQFSFAGLGSSEGKYEDMTFERQGKQIDDVLYWMRKQKYINPQNIHIIAQSCGAPSTLLADTKNIQSIIFICGAFNTYENLKRMFMKRNAFNPEGVSHYPRSDGSMSVLSRGFWDTTFSMKENELIKKKTMPVFLIGGTVDDYVMKEDIEHADSIFPNPKKKLKIYTGGNHGMDDIAKEMRKEFLQDICDFYESNNLIK